MPVIGDIKVAPGGRALQRQTNPGRAWAQQAEAAFSFTANTYRHDRNAGFPASISIFTQSITPDLLANLVRYALSLRPNVAEVLTPDVTRSGREWLVTCKVRLTSGDTATVNFSL